MPDEQERRRLHKRLDEVMGVATEARDEARGAHSQARRTNGRVDTLERVVWGEPTSLNHQDGGVVGMVRTLRRDIRVGLAVISGLLLPILGLLARPYLDQLLGG